MCQSIGRMGSIICQRLMGRNSHEQTTLQSSAHESELRAHKLPRTWKLVARNSISESTERRTLIRGARSRDAARSSHRTPQRDTLEHSRLHIRTYRLTWTVVSWVYVIQFDFIFIIAINWSQQILLEHIKCIKEPIYIKKYKH